MDKIACLEDLYRGNINPNEKCFDKSSEYAKLANIITENEQLLTAFLKALPNADKEQHMFSQMINAQSEITDFSELDKFIEGFRLGASLMLETFVLPNQSVIRDI